MSKYSHLKWGSNGRNGTEALVIKPLDELESDHLNNILACCGWFIPYNYKLAIYEILESRGVKPLRTITAQESMRVYDGYITKRDAFIRESIQ